MENRKMHRRGAPILAAVLTAGLLALLLFFYLQVDRPRTLRQALAGMDGPPLSFCRESGFFEDGFLLEIEPGEEVPRRQDGALADGIEIRYTLNGDEPTADSFLYEGGIDLGEACRQARASQETADARRAEIVRQAQAERQAAAAEAAPQAGQSAAAEAAGGQADSGENAAEAAPQAGQSAAGPDLMDNRALWEQERWSAASDGGTFPEREDDGICVIPVRARLVQGQDISPVVTRTYVIGPGVQGRFAGEEDGPGGTSPGRGSDKGATEGTGAEGKPEAGAEAEDAKEEGAEAGAAAGPAPACGVYVACIETDAANLFDEDEGVMVAGSHYQKDVDEGIRPDRAGNFYQEGDAWVKDGHVTLFSPDGEVLMEEDAGLSISGYSSRILPTRSFRAEASVAHGSSADFFDLDIFSQTAAEGAGDDITSFKKIKFRTHGVPQYHIRSVRNQYAKILADQCGFPGLAGNRLGVMFLNGEFYSVIDLCPSADKDYLCKLFGLGVRDAVEKYSGSDVDVYTKAKILRLFEADLTDPANQKALEAAVDMDNYLAYMALEVLFNNADWPYNNVTLWRYLGERDPNNPYSDGRFRFVLDDMDQILTNGLHGDPARWSSELIDYLMKDKGHTFHHVMDCKKYRDAFLTYVEDDLATAFAPDRACALLDALYGAMRREYILDYGQAFWDEMEETARVTKQNVREKESLYRANIEKYMGLAPEDRYAVRLEAEEGLTVAWQGREIGAAWENKYYRGTSFTATARAAEGYRFLGWEVNGKTVSADPALEISDSLLPEGAGRDTVLAVRALAAPRE